MKLIKYENYEISVADEALLVKPFRKLFHQDRSARKERFLEQMSVIFFVYSPASDYFYITDEEERLKEVLEQQGIENFTPSTDFKAAVDVYKKMNHTPEIMLLEDTYSFIEKSRKLLREINYEEITEAKDQFNTMKTGMATVALIPKLMKDLSAARRAVEKEIEENSGKARGTQELTLGDVGLD
jgi:hypothetical protein